MRVLGIPRARGEVVKQLRESCQCLACESAGGCRYELHSAIRKAPKSSASDLEIIDAGGNRTPAPDAGVNYAKLTDWAAGRGQYVSITSGARLQFAALADERAKEWDSIRDVMLAIELGRQTLPWEVLQ